MTGMVKVSFEPMEISHINDIVNIERLSFTDPWSRSSFINELENSTARYLAAIIGVKVVGYGGYWLILDEAHITNIAVHPQYRSQGIGSSLLSAMIGLAEREGAGSMTLEVRVSNRIAQAVYQKHGFTAVGVRKKYYQDNGEDALIMWKTDMNPL
jgi:ribosomal-protein-alanine N-acetyltransferase